MSYRRQVIWAGIVFLTVSVLVLGVRPMIQPDEPRNGIIAAEMVESGNWLSLRMAGFHYYEKPPLGYWMIAASIQVFGENGFAIRLPSAIATGIAALAAGILAVRVSGRRELGPLAFLVQATTIGPLVLGTVANLDAMFSAWIALCLVAFYAACTAKGRNRIGWLAVAGATSGLAFLTKGLLGLAIPGITAIAYLSWERRWLDLVRMPWIPLVTSLAIVAPVAVALHRSEPGFWEYFLVVEHFRRFASPDANQHGEPWWYLIALLPVGALMWTLTWPRVWGGLRRAGDWKSGIRLAVAWIVAPLAVLSMSAGKLPTYVLPLFVPIAVLVTLGLMRAHEQKLALSTWSRLSGRWILRALAIVAFATAMTGTAWIGLATIWGANPALHLIAIGCAMLIWAQIDVWSWRATDAKSWLMRTATAPVAVLALIPYMYPDAFVRRTQMPWSVLEAYERALSESGILVSTSQLGHCVCWVTGRRDILIVGRAGEFDNELNLSQDSARLVTLEEVAIRIRAAPSGGIAVVTSPEDAKKLVETPGIASPATQEIHGDIAIVVWK